MSLTFHLDRWIDALIIRIAQKRVRLLRFGGGNGGISSFGHRSLILNSSFGDHKSWKKSTIVKISRLIKVESGKLKV